MEILSKDKLIKYLMETQTAILNLVTSAKNQEETQENTKIKCSTTTTTKSTKLTYTTTFFM